MHRHADARWHPCTHVNILRRLVPPKLACLSIWWNTTTSPGLDSNATAGTSSGIHLYHKSVNQNAVLEFTMILSSPDVNRTWALCLFKFGIGILTEIFMNSEPSGILYCLIWLHELRTCRNARGRSTEWLTRFLEITVSVPRDSRGTNEVRYGL